jgi:trimethylamine--corrinoid protein Co-methyltransferase
MATRISFLTEEEKNQIHQDSLQILAECGVLFHSPKAVAFLHKCGAIVADSAPGFVKLPPELVEEALKQAPKAFTLGARNPKFDIDLPSAVTKIGLDGQATFTLDFESGERRQGRAQDITDSCRLLQSLPQGGLIWPNVKAHDLPLSSMLLGELYAALSGTSKHAQHELHHPGQAPYLLEILEAVAGGAEELKSRKILSVVYCTLPPLQHEGEMAEAYMELLPYKVPILVLPMNAPGSTGPASLYSNLSLANAEALSAFCLFQLIAPGHPMIYCTAMGGTSFSDGSFLAGSVEAAILNASAVEMGRFYGLPTAATGCASEAKMPGEQAVMEKMQTTLLNILAEPDLLIGIGELDSAQLLALEQILIDYEIVRASQRIKDGLDSSPAKRFQTDIFKVGPGGNFFALPSTAAMCRSDEFAAAGFCHRGAYQRWQNSGAKDMRQNAREKVQQILSKPVEDPLPEKVKARIEDVLRRQAAGV